MKKIDQINVWIMEVVGGILGFCIIIMSCVLIANVFCRMVLGFSLSFAEEVGQNLLVVVTFLGISYCAAKGKHINMLAIFDIMPTKMKKIVSVMINGLVCIMMFFLAYISFTYVLMLKEVGKVTTALQFPVYLVATVVMIGFILAGIEYGLILYKNCMNGEIYVGLEKEYMNGKEERL